MSRTLLILRHAKAVEAAASTPDFARPLSTRGVGDAAVLAAWFRTQALPELVVCSPATRTRQTLEALGFDAIPTIFSPALYLADSQTLMAQLHAVDHTVQRVLVIGHNPGLHQWALELASPDSDATARRQLNEKFPTTALASFVCACDTWSHVAAQRGHLTDFSVSRASEG